MFRDFVTSPGVGELTILRIAPLSPSRRVGHLSLQPRNGRRQHDQQRRRLRILQTKLDEHHRFELELQRLAVSPHSLLPG